jgi:hypothetical protein
VHVVFEAVEKDALRPLPAEPFVLATWAAAKIGPDIYAQVDRVLYSVPWQHIGKTADVRITGVNRGRSRSTAATAGGSLEAWARQPRPAQLERRPITMPWIIALAFIAIVALIIVSFAVHFLVSPWLLVAVAIVAWIKFRPHRSQR